MPDVACLAAGFVCFFSDSAKLCLRRNMTRRRKKNICCYTVWWGNNTNMVYQHRNFGIVLKFRDKCQMRAAIQACCHRICHVCHFLIVILSFRMIFQSTSQARLFAGMHNISIHIRVYIRTSTFSRQFVIFHFFSCFDWWCARRAIGWLLPIYYYLSWFSREKFFEIAKFKWHENVVVTQTTKTMTKMMISWFVCVHYWIFIFQVHYEVQHMNESSGVLAWK